MSKFAKVTVLVSGFLGCGAVGLVAGYLLAAYWRFDPGDRGGGWGSFPARAKTEWLDDGRTMRLLEDFVYVDKTGKAWVAEKDHVVDGASIPWPVWSVTGGPFEGKYRNASIVHDVGCDRMTEECDAVHRMFYEACLCGGAGPREAMILYGAVHHFGPRWVLVTEQRTLTTETGEETTYRVTVPQTVMRAPADEEAQRRLSEYIRTHDLTREQVESLDPATFAPEPSTEQDLI